MPRRARLWRGLWAVLLAAGAVERAGGTDYPQNPSNPPQAIDRAQSPGYSGENEAARPTAGYSAEFVERPAPLRQPAELQPASVPRGAELRQPGDANQNAFVQREPAPQVQPADYQAASAAQPLADAQSAPNKPLDSPAPIPLGPRSAVTRSVLRGGDLPPWLTGVGSLGIVLALFMLVVWVVRRGMPASAAPLPREAVEVLGRTVLAGRQQVHLVRFGNKMLLVCVSPGGVETLGEIIDPLEVDRLAGICQPANSHSAAASFRQMFQQFGSPPESLDYLTRRGTDDLGYGELDIAQTMPGTTGLK